MPPSRPCSTWRWCRASPCRAAQAATACRSACRSWRRDCTIGRCWRWRSARNPHLARGDFLSADAARRIALAAQGFGVARPDGGTNLGHVRRAIERRGAWWGWNDGKLAVEWLFSAGLVTTATRRGTFERVYDLTERVLPAHVQALATPSAEEAQRELLRMSSRALGVATEFDLRDYFRLGVADTKARLAER